MPPFLTLSHSGTCCYAIYILFRPTHTNTETKRSLCRLNLVCICVRVCMRLLCLNHIETTTNNKATHHKWLAEGKRMRRSNSEMYTPHNTSAIQTHIQNICGNFMENSKRVHSIFHSRSLFFRSPRNPSHHPYSLIYSFIPFQSVNARTRSNYTLSVFGRFFEKPAFHFHFSVCV